MVRLQAYGHSFSDASEEVPCLQLDGKSLIASSLTSSVASETNPGFIHQFDNMEISCFVHYRKHSPSLVIMYLQLSNFYLNTTTTTYYSDT